MLRTMSLTLHILYRHTPTGKRSCSHERNLKACASGEAVSVRALQSGWLHSVEPCTASRAHEAVCSEGARMGSAPPCMWQTAIVSTYQPHPIVLVTHPACPLWDSVTRVPTKWDKSCSESLWKLRGIEHTELSPYHRLPHTFTILQTQP